MTDRTPTAALRYEPDGYVQGAHGIMGRQAAGGGFLRAAVQGRDGDVLWACTPHRPSAQSFADAVAATDPTAETKWCPAHRLDLLESIGTLYLPGPDLLLRAAELRLRRGIAAYGLCGVTHTTASHRAMDALSGLALAPLMPWDALICTSSAVLATLEVHRAASEDYLAWRFGGPREAPRLLTPVIPLGVHCDDFAFTEADRAEARATLRLDADQILVLYVGRLAFHAKAHPDAMYMGLEAAARRSGKRIVLLQAGWFATDKVEVAYREGAATAAPSIEARFGDGQDPDFRRTAWAAADIFISLSDNIQETFGLTPIEAMAAGLPAIVSDWDGYKDTVRDGVDGFRVPTWMVGSGDDGLALRHESGSFGYDRYCGLSCQTVAIDQTALAERLDRLVTDTDLRSRMGAEGRKRARSLYDWPVVYRQYRSLWDEQAAIRRAAFDGPLRRVIEAAPHTYPSRLAPSASFAHYPTEQIVGTTRIVAAARPDGLGYADLIRSSLFSYADKMLCDADLAGAILARAEAPIAVAGLAGAIGQSEKTVLLAVAMLAKMGLLSLSSR
jgi:glycosyltransferase involved in cell wall biosynthesis